TISRSTSIGIFLHNSTVNEITGNTVYGTEGLHISYDWDGQDSHQTVKNNVIYNLDENKIPLTIASQLSAMGNESMDNNYYCNPYRNITTAYNGSDGKQYYFGLEQWKQFSGKDPNSKGSLISLTPYIPFDTLGQDLIKNGTFDSNLTDWTYWFLGIDNMSWANDGGMDQGSIKMSLNQSSSAASYGIVFSPNFDLKQNSFYALSSSIKGFNLGTMNIDIQHQVGDANGTVYSSKAALITSKRNMNFVFKTSSLANTQNFVSFLFPRTGSGFYLDNVHLYEVNAKYQEPTSKSVLFSNPSDYTKTFDLQQAIFNDLDGNQITKELTLQPWSSQILILMEGTYQPVVPTTVEPPFYIYPNPVLKGKDIKVNLQKIEVNNLKLNIYDSIGRLVYSQSLEDGVKEITINTSNFGVGMFLLNLSGIKFSSTHKFLIVTSLNSQ
ncbi:MAG: T9SS type A sorting domain-containing protein, partial [Bacteroidota bacterium]|nr:T9SS type A sorting domain-containing protein [Bacteroidota bacterium]